MKIGKEGFFIGISLIFIISLFCVAAVAANSITVTSKPSAKSSLAYKDYTVTWENQCPLCGHSGTLVFNPKGTYEGELTCSRCGADYCSVTGKDKHGGGPRAHLTVDENHSKHGHDKNLTHEKNKTNETNETTLKNLILNEIDFTSYSYITATVLEKILP